MPREHQNTSIGFGWYHIESGLAEERAIAMVGDQTPESALCVYDPTCRVRTRNLVPLQQ